MDTIKITPPQGQPIEKTLKRNLERVLEDENLDSQRDLVKNLAAALDVDMFDIASALLFINQGKTGALSNLLAAPADLCVQDSELRFAMPSPIKMVRYRLEVGIKHGVTLEKIKKTLIEESGVDKNNILNVDIQDLYTLMELPDEMPQDIFQHLQSVEINRQKLDLKRVKNRNHVKRGHQRSGRGRHRKPKPPSREKTDERFNQMPIANRAPKKNIFQE